MVAPMGMPKLGHQIDNLREYRTRQREQKHGERRCGTSRSIPDQREPRS